MNREIKFRGIPKDKDKYGNGFVYGDLICNNPGIGEMTYYIRKFCDWNLYMEVEIKEESIGQYTGLKDENNAEIYENDIIKYTQHHFNTHMVRDSYKVVKWKYDRWGIYESAAGETGIQISGNIHENSELLK